MQIGEVSHYYYKSCGYISLIFSNVYLLNAMCNIICSDVLYLTYYINFSYYGSPYCTQRINATSALRFSIEIEIENDGESNHWVLDYFNFNPIYNCETNLVVAPD